MRDGRDRLVAGDVRSVLRAGSRLPYDELKPIIIQLIEIVLRRLLQRGFTEVFRTGC